MLKITNYKGTRPLNTSKRAHITGNRVNGIVTAIYEVRGVIHVGGCYPFVRDTITCFVYLKLIKK